MSPLEKAPSRWQAGECNYNSHLTLAIAKKMLRAGEKEAVKQKVPLAMAISDSGGNLLAFQRMDNTALFGIQIAMDKAYTAVFGKMATGKYADLYRSGQLVPLFFHERWVTFHGGYPIIKDSVLVGGLGISGGVLEDIYVAKEMLLAGGFSTDEVDEFISANLAELKKGLK
jgi:uncharacterized protein GlcG (DUF336 family)